MNKSPKSRRGKRSFKIVATVLVASVLLAWPVSHYAHCRALDATRRGDAQSDPARALVWYKVAATLSPHDPRILDKLAASDIKNGNDANALTAATRAIAHGAGGTGYILKSQALLELNRTDDAIQALRQQSDKASQLQLGLDYAAAGDIDRLQATIAHLDASGAAQTLLSVDHNHLALVQELYVLGLLRSSQRVLQKYQVESSQSYLLAAHITLDLGHNSKTALEQGRGLVEKAVAISPERVDLRQALESIDLKLGDTAAAEEQGSKIQALEAGKV